MYMTEEMSHMRKTKCIVIINLTLNIMFLHDISIIFIFYIYLFLIIYLFILLFILPFRSLIPPSSY